jgi:hypothetical protein
MAARARGVLETNCPQKPIPGIIAVLICAHGSQCALEKGQIPPKDPVFLILVSNQGDRRLLSPQRTAPTREPVSAGRLFEQMINTRRLPSSPPTHP